MSRALRSLALTDILRLDPKRDGTCIYHSHGKMLQLKKEKMIVCSLLKVNGKIRIETTNRHSYSESS